MTTDKGTWQSAIDEYQPTIDHDLWIEISPFVLEAARRVGGQVPYHPRRVLHALTLLARCSVQQGWPLERSSLLTREVIDYAVSQEMHSLAASSRASIRPILLRVAEVLTPSLVPARLSALPASNPATPYESLELQWFRNWASGQRGRAAQLDAAALLAFSAGAGLSAGELLRLKRDHVEVTTRGSIVHVVSGRQREVPLLRSWESLAREVNEERQTHDLMFRPGGRSSAPNYIGNFLFRSRDCGHGKPQIQRLRATWIVTHLTAGTHARSLVAAAGVDSLEALTRYLKFVPIQPDADAEEALRRAG